MRSRTTKSLIGNLGEFRVIERLTEGETSHKFNDQVVHTSVEFCAHDEFLARLAGERKLDGGKQMNNAGR